ncbi:hypothetical protein GMI70_07045 [Eggerthellaceae bacterium zg-893]|nr:hypothetical protein [Eggerthellaceae bacterium zg-893]
MTPESIKAVVGLVCESKRDGDEVGVSINVWGVDDQYLLSINSAPSHVLDAIADNGYYLKVEHGSLYVSEQEG